MKFITDENIATSVMKRIRKEGFDVKDIKESKLFGISDKEIIDIALNEERIIITHDKNFGNIINNPKIKHKGVIFIRLIKQNPEKVIEIFLKALKSDLHDKFENALILLNENQTNIINN